MKVFSDRACVLCSSFASIIALHLTKIKLYRFLQCQTQKVLNFSSLRYDSVVPISIFQGYLLRYLFSFIKPKQRQKHKINSPAGFSWWSCCDVISTVKWVSTKTYQCLCSLYYRFLNRLTWPPFKILSPALWVRFCQSESKADNLINCWAYGSYSFHSWLPAC